MGNDLGNPLIGRPNRFYVFSLAAFTQRQTCLNSDLLGAEYIDLLLFLSSSMLLFYLVLPLLFSSAVGAVKICQNETVQLKTSWALQPANYSVATLCYKKILIPEDSYAEIEIIIKDITKEKEEKEAWFVVENSLGFAST